MTGEHPNTIGTETMEVENHASSVPAIMNCPNTADKEDFQIVLERNFNVKREGSELLQSQEENMSSTHAR